MARPAGGKPKGGKKNRKHGRNKAFGERYRREGRREKNKARRLRRHLRHNPQDRMARSALKRLPVRGESVFGAR